jgi:predicted alpha/beta superfamily hydrolase
MPFSDPGRSHTLTGIFRYHRGFRSRFLPSERDIIVYLPPGYEEPRNANRRYPVLYLQDGQNCFDGATSFVPGLDGEWQADETAERLIRAGTIEPLILVGVYNAGAERINEYTPTRSAERNIGGQADRYGRLLVEEIKPLMDRTYRTKTGAQNTGLGGSSLGGLVTLQLGLDHPGTFGKLAVVSPSVWWDHLAIVRRVRAVRQKPAAMHIWMDMGTNEGEARSARQQLEMARLLRRALIAKGWNENDDLRYFEAEGGEHNERAWAARFPAILTYLFPAAKK